MSPTTKAPRTLGEAVEPRGDCQIMCVIGEIAKAVGRIPVGLWDYAWGEGWRLRVNGTTAMVSLSPETAARTLAPYHAVVCHGDWPVAIVNPVEGTVIGLTEDAILDALKAELTRVQAEARR